MEQNLKELFDRALEGEPLPPPGDLTLTAMGAGRRIRRRRQFLVGGSAAAALVGALVLVNVVPGPENGDVPLTVPAAAAAMAKARPECDWTTRQNVTDVSIFLTYDVTDAQRAAIDSGLQADPTVRNLEFESREAAYVKFKELWKDSPDFVQSVGPESLPESFRLTMTQASHYPDLLAVYQNQPGVQDIVGGMCPGTGK
ncbi:permease-like cell division protein FtsX [Winogradskya humida]|uniref:FtsX extracellular domain-containing protein n=1 Tax=Winogradskya humida TaxID=113566 RepID=A0ABQ4A395_9ACTN|nr:permease-like cell division protein FtsX [Actinoplanes humidus]GIE25209.1 hypothetical protein Ahu01nite_083110 [Actinoplanes humidus]